MPAGIIPEIGSLVHNPLILLSHSYEGDNENRVVFFFFGSHVLTMLHGGPPAQAVRICQNLSKSRGWQELRLDDTYTETASEVIGYACVFGLLLGQKFTGPSQTDMMYMMVYDCICV